MTDDWMLPNSTLDYPLYYYGNESWNSSQWPMDSHFEISDFESPNLLRNSGWRIFMIILFGAVIFLGFIENLMVIIVIIINRRLHTVTNIFISTLAFSDIMLCAFNLPFQLHYGLTDYWSFGPVLCQIIIPMFAVPVFMSTLAMLMIAVERYILIVFPFRKRLTIQMALIIVFFIIIFSVVCSIPIILHTEQSQEVIDLRPFIQDIIEKSFCIENWKLKTSRAYTMFVFVLQFFIPYIIISVLYFQIYQVLKKRPIKRKETRKNYQTTRILIAITTTFTISWLPFQIFSIVSYFNPNISTHLGHAYKLTDLILKIIAMSSACVNPFLYGWLNDKFRQEFGTMLGKRMKKMQVSRNGYFRTSGQTSIDYRTERNCATGNL
ncbi:neuropeptide Y receptor type 5-like [Saccostrea echinata]|uniref:neuropeptide Y receptor type 5-like n=1 Tax=Saccostrea echinata TaxID=191078 RepID=UPI002A7F65BF|nr:neuropeptide Y receptor type 5-like [Saccostrea echinata]